LQRVRATVSSSTQKDPDKRNAPGDVDREIISLQRYLDLVAEGQTMALDMLFAPDWAMITPPAPLWREIQAATPRLVSRRASSFLRYCRQQANRFGIKGSRVAAARTALALLTDAEAEHGTTARLAAIEAELTSFAQTREHVALTDLLPSSGQAIRSLDLCGRKMPLSIAIKSAREIAQRLVNEYGQRALQAERNEGVDWKALSHAIRVGQEALELLRTGRITFPLRSAAQILAAKKGERPYQVVATEIERLLVEVEAAAATSTLPDAPDQAFIDELVMRAHREKILGAP
ncbi:MAG: hypothetical protein P4L99_00660, partial [Chthoniobacter sp.]|nr:hypothetical protein [Chthoniobacter sp.]